MGVVAKDSRDELFSELVLPYVSFLESFARNLLHQPPQDINDLVQETLLKAYRSLDRYDGDHPKTWLATILRNTTSDNSRKQQIRKKYQAESYMATAGSPEKFEPELMVFEDLLEPTLEDAIKSLDPVFQETLLAIDIMGMTYQECADHLNIRVGTAKTRLHRARIKLRTILQDQGCTNQSAIPALSRNQHKQQLGYTR